ncbi:hypothetical protein HZB60_08385 [candidate division KSB1 bacterium]|nr:hypothetical protein [candidate division KSB1 bacterium]
MTRRNSCLLLVALIGGWGIDGCDLFRTRDAEPPDSGRSSWETPLTPADVLDNLAASMFEHNAEDYRRSLDSRDFVFEADAVALAQDPALADWGYEEEVSHVVSLMSQGTLPSDSVLTVVFFTTDATVFGDSAQLTTGYALTAQLAVSGAPRDMAGTAEFVLGLGSEGYWQIRRWRDSRTEAQNTWSDLKSLVK